MSTKESALLELESILSLLLKLDRQHSSPQTQEAVDRVVRLAKSIQESSALPPEPSPNINQLNELLTFVSQLASTNFRQRLRIFGDGGTFDAIAGSLNMLAEELQYSVISKNELIEQTLFLETIIDSIPSILFVKDLDGHYIICNQGFACSFGRKKIDVIGKNAYDLFPRENADAMTSRDQEIIRAGRPLTHEELIPTVDGLRWHLVSLFPLKDLKGHVYAIGGAVKDIHELKQLKEDLQAERNRLSQIIATAPATLYTCTANADLRPTFVAPNIEDFGYTAEQVIGHPSFWLDHIHPEDRERVVRDRQQIFKSGKFRHEYRFERADGRIIWVRDELSLVRDENGAPKEIIGFWTDATEEILVSGQYQSLFNALDGAAIIALTDSQGRITFANDKFTEISGYSREELIGKDHRLLNSGTHPKEFFRKMWGEIKSGRIWNAEVQNKRKDGTFYWVNTTIAPMRNRAGKTTGFISVRFDITAEKTMQQTLIQSSKMASLGEMAGGIAHEINNPLAIIIGKTRQLNGRLSSGDAKTASFLEQAIAELNKVESTADRIVKIVKGLKAFSRKADGDPLEEASLAQIVDDTLELCRDRFIKDSIEVRIDVPKDLKIECRPTQISQVLMNLLGNAHDAVENLEERWVELKAVRAADRVVISVTDSGTGIAKDVVERIMVPFFTTKEVGKGTGLGLSLSKGIAEDHGGDLRYDPTSPRTRFIVELALKQAQESRRTAA